MGVSGRQRVPSLRWLHGLYPTDLVNCRGTPAHEMPLTESEPEIAV